MFGLVFRSDVTFLLPKKKARTEDTAEWCSDVELVACLSALGDVLEEEGDSSEPLPSGDLSFTSVTDPFWSFLLGGDVSGIEERLALDPGFEDPGLGDRTESASA